MKDRLGLRLVIGQTGSTANSAPLRVPLCFDFRHQTSCGSDYLSFELRIRVPEAVRNRDIFGSLIGATERDAEY